MVVHSRVLLLRHRGFGEVQEGRDCAGICTLAGRQGEDRLKKPGDASGLGEGGGLRQAGYGLWTHYY